MHQQRFALSLQLGQARPQTKSPFTFGLSLHSFSVRPFFKQASISRKPKANTMQKPSVYIGGTRSLEPSHPAYSVLRSFSRAVVQSGCLIHVGCQQGADQAVIWSNIHTPSFLVVFAVAHTLEQTPPVLERAFHAGASLTLSAGNTSQTITNIKARFLLRSKAAFAGCGQAVFFQPGAGSLAVARECAKAKIPVFAFATVAPLPIPSTAGQWQPVGLHSYYAPFQNQAVQCWQFQPSAVQTTLL